MTTKPEPNIDLAARLIDQAAKLLTTASTKQPAVSPRVAAILRALGVTVTDLHMSRNSSTPRGALSVATRRSVVAYLASEGLSVAQIAIETGMSTSTIRDHLARMSRP